MAKETTDVPDGSITNEMQKRINTGRLDWREGVGWHDPKGYEPEKSRYIARALRY